jgi:hypothetical protein
MPRKFERPLVILESPYAGDVEENVKYAIAAMKDSFNRGETPFASHLLYTNILDDSNPIERMQGIEAGLMIGRFATKTVVYRDRGISEGMAYGIRRAEDEGRPVEFREIEKPQRGAWE